MKKIHVDCSFTPGFDDSFDIVSPVDIPIILSEVNLWEWMKYWEANGPYAFACFYNINDECNAEYKMYQMLVSTPMKGDDGEIHRGFATTKTFKLVSDAIREALQKGTLSRRFIVIPRGGIYPQSDTLISPNKLHDTSFSFVEEEIAKGQC